MTACDFKRIIFLITNLHISLNKKFTTGLYKDSPIFSWIASWFVIQFDANFTQILENVTKCQMVFVRLAECRHMCKLFCTIPQRNHMMNSSVNYPINLWSYSVGNCPVQNKYQTIQCHAPWLTIKSSCFNQRSHRFTIIWKHMFNGTFLILGHDYIWSYMPGINSTYHDSLMPRNPLKKHDLGTC